MNQNVMIFIKKTGSENVVCKMAAIFGGLNMFMVSYSIFSPSILELQWFYTHIRHPICRPYGRSPLWASSGVSSLSFYSVLEEFANMFVTMVTPIYYVGFDPSQVFHSSFVPVLMIGPGPMLQPPITACFLCLNKVSANDKRCFMYASSLIDQPVFLCRCWANEEACFV